MLQIKASEAKRVRGLISTTVKAGQAFQNALQASSAACLWYLMCGQPQFINELYHGLKTGGSANAAETLRTVFMPKVIDMYGLGGIRDPEDVSKWQKRPTAFLSFGSKLGVDGKGGFELVSVKNNPALTEKQVQEIKAARKAIRDAGEDALNTPDLWASAADVDRAATFNSATSMKNLLMKQARFAYQSGISRDVIVATAKAFNVADTDIQNIAAAYQSKKPEPVKDDEFDELEKSDKFELIKANGAGAGDLPPVPTAKGKMPAGEPAHA